MVLFIRLSYHGRGYKQIHLITIEERYKPKTAIETNGRFLFGKILRDADGSHGLGFVDEGTVHDGCRYLCS